MRGRHFVWLRDYAGDNGTMNAPSELRCLKTDQPCDMVSSEAGACPCLNCQVHAQFNRRFEGKKKPYDQPRRTLAEWWERPGGSL
jgi:hypothetical protein